MRTESRDVTPRNQPPRTRPRMGGKKKKKKKRKKKEERSRSKTGRFLGISKRQTAVCWTRWRDFGTRGREGGRCKQPRKKVKEGTWQAAVRGFTDDWRLRLGAVRPSVSKTWEEIQAKSAWIVKVIRAKIQPGFYEIRRLSSAPTFGQRTKSHPAWSTQDTRISLMKRTPANPPPLPDDPLSRTIIEFHDRMKTKWSPAIERSLPIFIVERRKKGETALLSRARFLWLVSEAPGGGGSIAREREECTICVQIRVRAVRR